MFADHLRRGLVKGYGTYQIKDHCVLDLAVQNGYNFFDSAELYKNEDLVIDVIKSYPDKQLFVSTKISYIAIEKNQIEKSFNERLKKFEGIKINLLLLHKPSDNCRRDWSILCDLYSKNRDRIDYIGVSNYDIKHLDQLINMPIPFVNQFELNPFNVRSELVDYCRLKGIIIVSHTTLTRKCLFEAPDLLLFVKKYQTTSAKLLLTWAIQNNYVTIPRSSRLDHMMENIEEKKYKISNEDMTILNNDLNIGFFLTKVMF
jgi:diketogulonate reductase-like aldo/keto reductase